MQYLSKVLFLTGMICVIVLAMSGPSFDKLWFLSHGDGQKLLAIVFFVAAGAAELIWGKRREA